MGLQEKLDAIKAKSKEQIPPEAQAVMQRAAEALAHPSVLERVVRAGDPAPGFALPNVRGLPVSLGGLLAKGPVVLTLYRGVW